VGSTRNQTLGNGPLSPAQAEAIHGQTCPACSTKECKWQRRKVAKDANSVPGFPQDAFMEGAGDGDGQRWWRSRRTTGSVPGWSGFMQGMMTFLRVLPPDMYDKVMALREQVEG